MLSNNYQLLSRPLNGPGVHVHTANRDEFMNITIQQVSTLDDDFHQVERNNQETIQVKLFIGKRNMALNYEFGINLTSFQISNIPIYEGEEAWISISKPNTYCAFGFSKKSP